MDINKIIEKSIVVAAHPDDEILWFSSILDKVDNVVLCFMGHKSKPNWTIGRKKSLSEYPLKNIHNLGIDAAEVFGGIDWQNPIFMEYGVKITNKKVSGEKYKTNFSVLKKKLAYLLADYRNVYTHNPWGEYGHEEHIQVYRVIEELQKEMKFNLWFTNYCSNKSFSIMLGHISKIDSQYISAKTNKTLSKKIKEIYTRNGCWTWYDNWVWLDQETFIRNRTSNSSEKVNGQTLPINLIKIESSSEKNKHIQKHSFKIKNLIANKKTHEHLGATQ